MRYLYSLLFYLILPFVLVRLWWRAKRLPDYSKRVRERFGFYPFKLDQCIWVHAVSVGETLAAVPMIKALKSQYPDLPIVVTTMTPTGAERVQSIFKDEVIHAYVPYDLPDAVGRFLNATRPTVGIIMETELWPNMFAICQQKDIPICLMNARLSEKSARGYARISSMTKQMLQNIACIAAHGEQDAKRLIALGAKPDKVFVTGNMKFDLEISDEVIKGGHHLRQQLGEERFVWIAASTHQGEEELMLAAHQKLREKNPQALLILVPRHPDRFNEVTRLSESKFKTLRRSENALMDEEVAVYLGDTMGELLIMLAAADVVVMGGSFISKGGHNLLEPAALSKPILTGESLFNFAEISERLFEQHALRKVTAIDLAIQLIQLMQNPSEGKEMGQRAQQVFKTDGGALSKNLKLIQDVLVDTEARS